MTNIGGMKRSSNKRKSSESLLKRTKSAQEKTGAPPPDFLSALEMEAPIHYCITQSRKQRGSFCHITTNDIRKRVWLDLMELADRIDNPKMTSEGLDDSAQALATVAMVAAELLEHLSSSDSYHERQMISFEARGRESWPVLLRLGVKRDKKGERYLEGADKAKAYLIRIGQGRDAAGLKYFGDRDANIFKRAAELLLHELIRWREQGAWRSPVTSWAKKLFALGDLPMTTDNVEKWWAVAKRWMDEQWETNPRLFKPLIESCKSKGKPVKDAPLYESEKKSRVIDLRLKEAFFALAKPADL